MMFRGYMFLPSLHVFDFNRFTFASILDSLIRVTRRVDYMHRKKEHFIYYFFAVKSYSHSKCGFFFHVQGNRNTLNNPILAFEKVQRYNFMNTLTFRIP